MEWAKSSSRNSEEKTDSAIPSKEASNPLNNAPVDPRWKEHWKQLEAEARRYDAEGPPAGARMLRDEIYRTTPTDHVSLPDVDLNEIRRELAAQSQADLSTKKK